MRRRRSWRCSELIAPVVGSTLTTVVVFVPLGMLSGVVGQFFRALSITLAAAVLISLVQALTLIPLLARCRGEASREPARRTHEHQAGRSSASTRARSIRRCGGRSLGIVDRAAARGCAAACCSCGSAPDSCRRRTRAASSSTTTRRPAPRCEEIDRIVREASRRCCRRRRTSRRSRAAPASELGLFATQQTKGDILVRLKPRGQRRSAERSHRRPARQADEGRAAIRHRVRRSCCRTCSATSRAAPTPIEVKVFGDDPDTLAELSEQVEEMLGEGQRRRGHRRRAARQPRDDVGQSIRRRSAAWAYDRRRCRSSCRTRGSATSDGAAAARSHHPRARALSRRLSPRSAADGRDADPRRRRTVGAARRRSRTRRRRRGRLILRAREPAADGARHRPARRTATSAAPSPRSRPSSRA